MFKKVFVLGSRASVSELLEEPRRNTTPDYHLYHLDVSQQFLMQVGSCHRVQVSQEHLTKADTRATLSERTLIRENTVVNMPSGASGTVTPQIQLAIIG